MISIWVEFRSRSAARTYLILVVTMAFAVPAIARTLRSATYLQCPSECSCLGNVVDCSKRALKVVPESLPHWVEILDLCSNSIESVTSDAFQGLERLVEINLSDNQLISINCSIFMNLPKLTTLKLGHCRLERLPSCENALNITHLALNHNDITFLETRFFDSLIELRSIDISYNKLMRLNNSTFPFLPNLHHLFMNNNQIQSLEVGSFDNLVSLEWLKLNKNRIHTLQKNTFLRLNHLKYLELERNRIRVIDGLVFQGLSSLLSLKLKRNVITDLMDGAFWGPNHMQILDLSYNNITSVSNKWLYGLESLLQLSLSHNQIVQITENSWIFCQHLNQLDLSHNRLTSLSDKTFDNLESLEILYMSHNQLVFISDAAFNGLSNLQILDLSYNEISWAVDDVQSPFERLVSLVRLTLQHNQIKSISKNTFEGLSRLRQLDLDENNMTSVQSNAFEALTEIRELRMNSSYFFCNCQISWLKRWLVEREFESSVTAQCQYPDSLKGRSLFDLETTDFKCVNFPKPIITHEPESQRALKFGNVTLTCQAATSTDSQLTIEWKKDNMVVTDVNVVTQMVTSGKDESIVQMKSVLHIHPVLDNHAGIYQCIAANALGFSYSNKAVVSVNVFPAFLKTPGNIVVKSGSTARLDCAASGLPQPEISLQKDGGDDFPAARERRMHIYPSDEMFFIVDVKSDDQGVYTCIAKNDVGLIMANASLQVLEAPSFVKQMENKMTSDGETTVLECMTSGSPKPRLEWLKDGRPLQPTLRHFFTADDQLLVIVQTQSSDAGKYTCVMTNTLGSERQTSSLKVVFRDGDVRGNGGTSLDESTTTGIIIIAVVCCIVGTSFVWVVVIYKTRQRRKRFRADDTIADDKRLNGGGRLMRGSGRSAACHEGSLVDGSVQGLLCPLQTSSGNVDGNVGGGNSLCPDYNLHPSAFPSDTEDEEEEEEEDGRRYSYCLSSQQNIRLPEEKPVRRHRSDSGTHTASSSLSSSTRSANNSNGSSSEPLHTSQPFHHTTTTTTTTITSPAAAGLPENTMSDTGQSEKGGQLSLEKQTLEALVHSEPERLHLHSSSSSGLCSCHSDRESYPSHLCRHSDVDSQPNGDLEDGCRDDDSNKKTCMKLNVETAEKISKCLVEETSGS